MDDNTFGRLLREARQRALLTLEGLAAASGVSVRAISDMERGQSLPRSTTLGELLEALGPDEDERRRLVRAARRRTHQAPRQLPPDPVVFHGREKTLAAVRAMTAQLTGPVRHVVISAIGGMAGVGKTTLAVHWAHQEAGRFPDGQLYVNLRGFEEDARPLDPGEALGGFLGALGVPSADLPAGTRERSALFRERVAALRLIVVLDNARDEEQVRPLLPASPGCLAIITSRERMSGLAATEGAALIALEVWSEAESLAALAARVGEERVRAEPRAAADLVGLCGQLPLAVAVVGAQLSVSPGLPLRVAVRELAEARLDALSVDDRRADVRAVFSCSYRTLPAETARFFRYLSLHPGPAASVESVASLAGVGVPAARRRLRELVSASLLTRDAEGRYVVHDLVRAYGAELVERHGDDRHGAEARLLHYLCHNAHAANRYIARYMPERADVPVPAVVSVAIDDREEALAWYRQEEQTAAAALRLRADPGLLRHRVGLVQEWASFHVIEGRWAEEITAQRVGLDAAVALDDPVALVRAAGSLARALVETGRLDEADEPVELILAQLHRLPAEDRGRAERSIAWTRDGQERHAEGLRHSRRALEIFRGLGQRDQIAVELGSVGWFLSALGEYREAIVTCEEAIPILRDLGDRGNEAAAWDSIGYARQQLGDPEAAIVDYERSLRLFEELFNDYSLAAVLDHLASAQLELGDVSRARASWTRAADLFDGLRVARAAEIRAKATALSRPEAQAAP
ncbi:ATP-binding protein [Streptomyces humi]|uniref:ATP-binding protein n=1 Tax=Streptomyces humi TaxID=1428620 RepID=UPI0006289904|nr:helix-turn-helix domain-containing protein [Streptomyces humi]